MTTKPSQADELSTGDSVLVWKEDQGDYRLIPKSNFFPTTSSNKPTTKYAAPNATGFSVSIGETKEDMHLILTPIATYAAGTIVLPPYPQDKQTVLVNSTQAVTALSFSGGTTSGAPTTLAANAFFTLKYDQVLSIWYRVG